MKKQDFTLVSLKLKKVSISNLTIAGGADAPETNEVDCFTEFPHCQYTITTRPDSLNHADEGKDDAGHM
ncbi:hypothetical protein U8527_20985 [Kordia algicida OT-1]|uniref:Uncharacterized protein n=1 Tax=Kordia algicida OT-1 TaxID=391587 RepID=A9DL54_9FLAO|nr:hypothetical protein [Kordia algicida]EDP98482.1 hypothetical protein KAOT1_14732 [Kordia algicida OT-1]